MDPTQAVQTVQTTDWTSILAILTIVGTGVTWMLRIAMHTGATVAEIKSEIKHIKNNCTRERSNSDKIWDRLDDFGDRLAKVEGRLTARGE